MALVITKWDVTEQPDADNILIRIHGRIPGIISFILSVLGIEPSTRISVSRDSYIFESGSWSGRFYRCIPIPKISSVYYGFSRPWKEALAWLVTIIIIGFALVVSIFPTWRYGNSVERLTGFIVVLLLALVVSLIYYLLNKKLTLGVFEIGGRAHGIEIKRSVIERKALVEKDAEQVGIIIQQLILAKN